MNPYDPKHKYLLMPPSSRIILAYMIAGAVTALALVLFMAFIAIGISTEPIPINLIAVLVLPLMIAITVFAPIGVLVVKRVSRNFNPTTGKNYFWGLSLVFISFVVAYHFYETPETTPLKKHSLFIYIKASLVFMLSAAVGGVIFDRITKSNVDLSTAI